MFTAYTLFRQFRKYQGWTLFFLVAFVTTFVWLLVFGRSGWEPAWPTLRTYFIIGTFSTFSWCMLMALSVFVVVPLTQRYRCYGKDLSDLAVDIELGKSRSGLLYPENDNPSSWPTTAPETSIRYLLLLFGTLIGILLCATYKQPKDYRFEMDIRASVERPRPQGYGSGGM